MRVLVGCELSGKVREAFRRYGHDAWSCDIEPADDQSPFHFQCDVLDVLDRGWDLAVFHPPCTYLSVSGQHWNGRQPGRIEKRDAALAFVRRLLDAPIPRIALENPISVISSFIRKPDQIIHPWMFGHDASKATCLWLKNLPPLLLNPALFVPPRIVNGRKRWGNQTDSGQNRLGPSADRAKLRSETYQGIADAFARNWENVNVRYPSDALLA